MTIMRGQLLKLKFSVVARVVVIDEHRIHCSHVLCWEKDISVELNKEHTNGLLDPIYLELEEQAAEEL